MSVDMLSVATSASSASQPSSSNDQPQPALPGSILSTTPSSSVQPPVNATSAAATGLTPDQVLSELKRSGYVDQVRRRMFDAFVAARTPATALPTLAGGTDGTGATSSVSSTAADSRTAISDATTSTAAGNTDAASSNAIASTAAPPSTSTTRTTPPGVASSTTTPDIGHKSTFLTYLSTLLTHHITQEHGNLRASDSRGQRDSLLKRLDSDPVEYPQRAELGEATAYDLLVRHIVMQSEGEERDRETKGMLDGNEGWMGKEVKARIGEMIKELLQPVGKDGEDEEEDDEEEDDDDEGAENAREGHSVAVRDAGNVQNPVLSIATQPRSPSHPVKMQED